MVLLGVALAGCGGSGASVAESLAPPASGPPVAAGAGTATPAASAHPSHGSSNNVAAAISAAARAASGGPISVPSAAPQQTAQAARLMPGARITIPEIGVDAPLVPLGVDGNGLMQVPDNGTDVGWYTFSAVPGQPGNAVLSGHLDTTTSYTAVFTRLKDLKIGDPMSVTVNGRTIQYQVFWTKAWPDADAPLPLILGSAPSPTLTLITCSGTFSRSAENYSARLVVRAKPPGTTT
ncbi:MAG: class F sortase [Chloroflexota bacterium]